MPVKAYSGSGPLRLEVRPRHEVHGPVGRIAERLGARVPAAAELHAVARLDVPLVPVGVDDDGRAVHDVRAVRLHLDARAVHYATRVPAWNTAHTRQSARASDSGSPWTRTRSAGLPRSLRPGGPAPR